MTIQAPAKVNLVLRILAKRDDGYHDIETLMVPVTLADEMDVEVDGGSGLDLRCDAPDLPCGSDNLVWRAVDNFKKRTGLGFSTRISLRKRIPQGAGLGGGSSDAAAVIKALDRLLKTSLPEMDLEQIAADTGSDVPFFIRCAPAWCRGRGERISGVDAIPAASLLLVKPAFPVSTAWAYQTWKPTTLANSQFFGDLELVNDLEAPAFHKYLLLPVIKNWLLEQEEVSAAMMSGSGSTIFAILKKDAGSLARRAQENFGESLWTAAVNIL